MRGILMSIRTTSGAIWDGGQVAFRPDVHFDACLTNLRDQVTQTAQPGLRRERGLDVALAQQSEQPAQLGHGLPTAQFNRLERLRGGPQARRQDPALGCGLHDDDAQAVRDDVVQFTGDSGPLGLDGTGGPGFLVTL
jgi:hypothetical protein